MQQLWIIFAAQTQQQVLMSLEVLSDYYCALIEKPLQMENVCVHGDKLFVLHGKHACDQHICNDVLPSCLLMTNWLN